MSSLKLLPLTKYLLRNQQYHPAYNRVVSMIERVEEYGTDNTMSNVRYTTQIDKIRTTLIQNTNYKLNDFYMDNPYEIMDLSKKLLTTKYNKYIGSCYSGFGLYAFYSFAGYYLIAGADHMNLTILALTTMWTSVSAYSVYDWLRHKREYDENLSFLNRVQENIESNEYPQFTNNKELIIKQNELVNMYHIEASRRSSSSD